MEAARRVLGVDTRDFLDLGRIRKPGHIEDDGAEVGVWRALGKLEGLHIVVAAVCLEVSAAQGAESRVQLGVVDIPAEDDVSLLSLADILEANDVEARRGRDAARHVRVGAAQLLFDIDVRAVEVCRQRHVRDNVEIGGAFLPRGRMMRLRGGRGEWHAG